MQKREMDILRLEEEYMDKVNEELVNKQTENRNVSIRDVKFVGQISWEDKISGKPLFENLVIVEKEIKEIDKDGKDRITVQCGYYLGDMCVGASIGDGEICFNQVFERANPDKVQAIKDRLSLITEEELKNNSFESLRRKELVEVLSAFLEREVTEKEVDELLKEIDAQELENFRKENEEKDGEFIKGVDGEKLEDGVSLKNKKDVEEKSYLTKKQVDKIKLRSLQKVDLNKKVDGKETLGKRLDLNEFDFLYIDYSENIKNVSKTANVNGTMYSIVGMTKDGNVKILDNEFEIDSSVGNGANRNTTKINANNTAERDNLVSSIYTRKSNGASIGCQNRQGNVDMYFYQKTFEENENIGIQIETSKTPVIPFETRDIMSRNRGIYQKERVQNEIQEHTDKGCIPKDVKDFDGDEDTYSHEYEEEIIVSEEVEKKDSILDRMVDYILKYQNDRGEEVVREVFTRDEVKEELIKTMKRLENGFVIDEITRIVAEEMGRDAEIFMQKNR